VVGKIKAMDYSIIDLANKIIEQAQNMKVKRLGLTKLQKLVYYVYGEYLAKEKIRLVKDDEPQKMYFGPVFPQLYELTKDNYKLDNKIDTNKKYTLKQLENMEILKTELNKEVLDNIIDSVLNTYGAKTARELSEDTHRSGYAWDKTKFFKDPLLDEYIRDEFRLRADQV
jgi:uncharacterized phage-associated protein